MPLSEDKKTKPAAKMPLGIFILLAGVLFLAAYSQYTVPILTYHSFGYARNLLSVSPDNFVRQMKYIKDKGYKVIPLDELVEGTKRGRLFAHNSVVITIDDGYRDNFVYAYPVLKEYGFAATIFLISGSIGLDRHFLGWDEIRQMRKNNIFFGGHGRKYLYLPSVKDRDAQWDEIKGSKDDIEKQIGAPVDFFCYPMGGFTARAKGLVKKAGYKAACATHGGPDPLNRSDLYALNRISMRNTDTDFSLWAKLSGYYNFFRP